MVIKDVDPGRAPWWVSEIWDHLVAGCEECRVEILPDSETGLATWEFAVTCTWVRSRVLYAQVEPDRGVRRLEGQMDVG